ncbi:MAG: hypothetical protein E7626_04890 [Ruminococcaceae bacterium]|nr:hypothetical protein [Oscillospiraceae bacterium]
MKNMFVRILACMLVLVMAFSFAACKDDADDGDATQNPPASNPGSDNDDWFSDPGDTPDDDTNGDDPVIEGPEEWDPWEMIKYFAVPNSNISISVIDVAEDGKITSLQLAKGSTMLLELDYTAAAVASSFEIKFGTETVKVAFGADGKIAILKGEEQLAISSAAYTGTSKVAIDWNGTKLVVKVGGAEAVSADYTVPADFEKSAELFLIAGEGAKFENAKATLGGSAIEFETRKGETWQIVETEGKHKNAFYTGYQGSISGYSNLALINNVDFANASKITISAKIAHGLQHKETAAKNSDTGFVVEVWNVNGEDGTSPIVYENQKISFFKVYLAGYGVSATAGKWGPTEFATKEHNNDGKWYNVVGSGKAGLPDEATIVDDGLKNDKGKYVYQAENVRTIDEYTELKVVWDRENLVLSYYYNGALVKSVKFSRNIFVNKDGSGIGIATAAGDVYFKDFNLIVE